MPCARLYGRSGVWRSVRRSLCADAADRVRRLSACETCAVVRDVVYRDDPRWESTAADPAYQRLFGHAKWWPEGLRARLRERVRERRGGPLL